MVKGKCLGNLRYLKDIGEQLFRQDCPNFGGLGCLCGR